VSKKEHQAVFQSEFIEDLRDWALFQPEFIEDLRYWVETDRKLALRAFELIEAILREPYAGIGKPEPLKYLSPGAWSRRLTQEHRIVYLVRDNQIDFLQARYHY
jgi:toxin YoeB